MWAAVKLGQRPEDQWLRLFLSLSRKAMPAMPPEALGNLAWCVASLEVCALPVRSRSSGTTASHDAEPPVSCLHVPIGIQMPIGISESQLKLTTFVAAAV